MPHTRPFLPALLVGCLMLTGCSLVVDVVGGVVDAVGPGSPPGAEYSAEDSFERPAADGVRLEPTRDGALSGRRVIVDAGHGGAYDPAVSGYLLDMGLAGVRPCYTAGTTALDGTPEHTLNHAIARNLAAQLRARGATVVLTRGDDESLAPCNDDRARIANRAGADLLVSIHGDGDAESRRGYHIIYAPNMAGGEALTERSKQAALTIAGSLRRHSPLPPANYKGTPDAPIDPRTHLGALSLLEEAPGVLVELGNLKNPRDVELLTGQANRDAVSSALADGVQRVLSG